MNKDDIIAYVVIVVINTIINIIITKFFIFSDKYLEKKAENLATKQDIEEITAKTENVQAEFHKILGEFDADLKFKYQFYEEQYKELYSELYRKICESEALRYILINLSGEHMDFKDVPIVEYEPETDVIDNQMTEHLILREIINLLYTKHIYASPELVKLVCLIESIESYQKCTNTRAKVAQIEHRLKKDIVKTILKDYYWLRQQLHLQESFYEIEKLETGKFIFES